MAALLPVSYTHLDVYKRQPYALTARSYPEKDGAATAHLSGLTALTTAIISSEAPFPHSILSACFLYLRYCNLDYIKYAHIILFH